MKAIIYARFSPRPSDKTPTESINVQIDRCNLFAQAKGWSTSEFDSFIDEGESGTKEDREGFQHAMNRCIETQGVFLVYSISRFFRNTEFALKYHDKLKKAGCTLASVTESIDTSTPTGKFLFVMLCATNELQRDQTAAATKAAHQLKASRNGRTSCHAPYGYRIAGEDLDKLVEDEDEKRVISLTRELLAMGFKSRHIKAYLIENGFKPREGEWTQNKFATVLRAVRRVEATDPENVQE